MIRPKTAGEIEKMAKGGRILAEILQQISREAVVGVAPTYLDKRAQELIAERGVKPSFLNYTPGGHKPFPAALCASVNHAVVHGLPGKEPLEDGDVVGLDLGIVYEGLYLDHACTVAVGKAAETAQHLMKVTWRALELGIAQAKLGNTTGDIGAAVQQYVEGEGLEVVRALVGHGVGYEVHEPPQVPNYGEAGQGEKLMEGLVIAIEPMVTIGSAEIVTAKDGWAVETKGGGLAAHEEHTVAITAAGPHILTALQ